jgi:hypothetical protein
MDRHIFALGWTKDLQLVVVDFLGSVVLYDLRGKQIQGPWKDKTSFSPVLLKNERVMKCIIWERGVAVVVKRNDGFCIFVATDFMKKKEPCKKYL